MAGTATGKGARPLPPPETATDALARLIDRRIALALAAREADFRRLAREEAQAELKALLDSAAALAQSGLTFPLGSGG